MTKRHLAIGIVTSALIALSLPGISQAAVPARPATLQFVSTQPILHFKAHAASCTGNCYILAYAYPQWVCDIQGAVVAAGTYILSDGAAAVASMLAGGVWTAGCHAIDTSYLSGSTGSYLQSLGKNCYKEWTRYHEYSNIRCQYWYAKARRRQRPIYA